MSTFRQNYVPAPVVPREPPRRLAILLLAVVGVCGAIGHVSERAEQRRLAQIRLEAFRAGYSSAQETACRPALAAPIAQAVQP